MAEKENEKEGMGLLGLLIVGVVCWIMYKYFIPSGGLLDNGAMEKPVTKAFEAMADGDYGAYNDQFFDLSTDDTFNEIYYYGAAINEINKEYYNITSNALTRDFGSDYKIKKIKVTDREKYDVTELYGVSKEITEAKNEFSAITDYYRLNVKVSVSSKKDAKTFNCVAGVVKVNGKWKCLMVADLDTLNSLNSSQ